MCRHCIAVTQQGKMASSKAVYRRKTADILKASEKRKTADILKASEKEKNSGQI